MNENKKSAPEKAPRAFERIQTEAVAKKPRTPRAQTGEKLGTRPSERASRPREYKRVKPIYGEKALRIIPLGGLGEIGKNLTMYESGEERILVDCGLAFPDDEMPGVDIVIPDFTYVVENAASIKALLVTHGHEDHIGGIPYLLKQADIPIFATKLTIGLIEAKLMEHSLPFKPRLNVISAGDTLDFGCFRVEAIRVNHSIPDAVAFAVRTPAGVIVQTGDFKVDYTPVFDETIDLTRFGQLGSEGVLALLSDSTNAEKPGSSLTESLVGDSLEKLFSRAEGKRLIIATFASNLQRIQQIIDIARRHKRKIALSGRSMENYTRIAGELGYLDIDDDMLVDVAQINRYKPSDLILITTGSQGEPLSALSRMAAGTHRQVSVGPGDLIIISATPIPGNEKMVTHVINGLLKRGSDVIYERMYETHVSGHANQDELMLMLQLVRPKFFIPVHGEYKHLVKHAKLAESLGVPSSHIIIPEIGEVIEFNERGFRKAGTVPSGRVFVDGLGVGDVGSVVLRDRKHLAQDGLMVVVCTVDPDSGEIISGPDVISRGFVYVKESEPLIDEAKSLTRIIIEEGLSNRGGFTKTDLRPRIREELQKLMDRRTKRSPMILPVIMEI
ncbi:MAG: ribonuclease J [Oscillospiraceae bacterium]|nr:ribonuclease J [Oscillospiraceae bacterium]